ncbi:MAG TPA: glycosyltransferase, partial [Oligoflexia bacterium]|nr:glycosyltransferase [Oligoflexia bacterium]
MERKKLRVGISCYPTFGGSGVIATEIGIELARCGHQVHFICLDVPRRLREFTDNIFFHEVGVLDYPLFTHPPYDISLASKMVEIATYQRLDLIHVHYAVPHATSALLAAQVLGQDAPPVVTTLHGTDITLVGNDPAYLPITRYSIYQSSGVTAPSQYLKEATYEELHL